MDWTELYPIVKEQAYYAVLRYDPRREEKMQELVCQAYELYKSYIEKGKEIRKQDFKAFVKKRANEVDQRSVCKDGYGGTSLIDVTCFKRRRPDGQTSLVEFDEDWMTANTRSKKSVDDTLVFNIDYKLFLEKLTGTQREILNYLISGYKMNHIAEFINWTISKVKQTINELKLLFVKFFRLECV